MRFSQMARPSPERGFFMKQMLSILGSTGSIGTQTLDVARRLGMRVCALAANRNVAMLENQIREWKPQLAAVFDLDAAKNLRIAVADTPVRVVQGMEGLCEAASIACADVSLQFRGGDGRSAPNPGGNRCEKGCGIGE